MSAAFCSVGVFINMLFEMGHWNLITVKKYKVWLCSKRDYGKMEVLCWRALQCNFPDSPGPDDINNINTAHASEHLPAFSALHCIFPLQPTPLLGVLSPRLSALLPYKNPRKLLKVFKVLVISQSPQQQCLWDSWLSTAVVNLTSGTVYK